MSLREALFSLGGDLNLTRMVIDKDVEFHGVPATTVSFEMDTESGRGRFEATIADDIGLNTNEKALLLIKNARHQAAKLKHDVEVER